MIWFSRKVDSVSTDSRVERLELELQSAKAAYQTLVNQYRDESRSADFCFNFNAVKAFSVERNIDGVLPVTVIGYMVPCVSDGKETFAIKEWFLHCDDAQHKNIVAAFKESIK
jgi:hypothetical protein